MSSVTRPWPPHERLNSRCKTRLPNDTCVGSRGHRTLWQETSSDPPHATKPGTDHITCQKTLTRPLLLQQTLGISFNTAPAGSKREAYNCNNCSMKLSFRVTKWFDNHIPLFRTNYGRDCHKRVEQYSRSPEPIHSYQLHSWLSKNFFFFFYQVCVCFRKIYFRRT